MGVFHLLHHEHQARYDRMYPYLWAYAILLALAGFVLDTPAGILRGLYTIITTEDALITDYVLEFLTVNKSAVINVNQTIIKEGAKSDAGNRTIPIPDSAVPFLRDYLKNLDTFYLFPGKNAATLSSAQYERMWKHIVKKMNDAITTNKEKLIEAEPIQGLTAHIFRHNYCTMLYYSGISQKKAVELMGHADIKMIMEVYAHLDDKKEAVQEKLSNAISL